jgi:hypothetical protein
MMLFTPGLCRSHYEIDEQTSKGRAAMVGHNEVGAGIALLAAAVSLARLWLLLWFRLCSERERRRSLFAVVRALPAGSVIQDRREDGAQLTLALGQTQRDGS